MLASIAMLCASQTHAWSNTYFNETDEDLTVVRIWLSTGGGAFGSDDTTFVPKHSIRTRSGGAACTKGLWVLKGNQKEKISQYLIKQARSPRETNPQLVLPKYSDAKKALTLATGQEALLEVVPISENRCLNWDFKITKDASGNLKIARKRHFFKAKAGRGFHK